jgi:hypothetical protein
MNRKQFQILLILAVIVGGLGLVVYQRNSASWEGSGSAATAGNKVLGSFALNDVSRVVIKGNSSTVTVARKNDAWVVLERSDYPADFARINNLVQGLWDLKTVQSVPVGPSQLGRLNLIAPSKDAADAGTLVELQGSDAKPIASLLIGKSFLKQSAEFAGEGLPAGRYVMPVNGANAKVSLVSELLDQAEASPVAWLDKGFFRLDGIASVTLSGSTPAFQWKLSRDSDSAAEWKLTGIKPEEKLDPTKVPPFLGLLDSISFADVLAPDAKPAGLDKPRTLTVETFDHVIYTLNIGAAQGENYPVAITLKADLTKERTPGKDEKPEDKKKLDDAFAAKFKELTAKVAKEKAFEARVYLVPKTTFDPLIKERSELLEEKKAEPSPSPAAAAPSPAAPDAATATPPLGTTATTSPMGLPEALTSGTAAASPAPSPATLKQASGVKKKSN